MFTNPVSEDLLSSRSQIQVFISIPDWFLCFSFSLFLCLSFVFILFLSVIPFLLMCLMHKLIICVCIAAGVNSTDWLSGGLISFCYLVMQLRLNRLMCTNTPTHTQTGVPFSVTGKVCVKYISSQVLRSVCIGGNTHTHTPTRRVTALLTGQAVISIMYFLMKPRGCGWH